MLETIKSDIDMKRVIMLNASVVLDEQHPTELKMILIDKDAGEDLPFLKRSGLAPVQTPNRQELHNQVKIGVA